MTIRRAPLAWLRLVSAVAVLFSAATSSAVYNECTYKVVSSHTVYTWGSLYDAHGKKIGEVIVGSTTTVHWGWECEAGSLDDGSTDSGGVLDEDIPVRISLISLDDSNPSKLLITVGGSSNIETTTYSLNGSVVATYPGSLSAGKVIYGPNVGLLPVGRPSTVTLKSCATGNRCASVSFGIQRTRRSNGTSGVLTATYFDQSSGTTVVKAARYSFSLGTAFNETTYTTVQPINNSTRVQFYSANTTLGYWSSNNTPFPMPFADFWTENMGSSSAPDPTRRRTSMTGCDLGPSIGDGDRWVHMCTTAGGFGYRPTAGTEITSMKVDVPYKGITTAFLVSPWTLFYQP